jgi:hypothetical protein
MAFAMGRFETERDIGEREEQKGGERGWESEGSGGAVEKDCNVLSKRTSRNVTSSAI